MTRPLKYVVRQYQPAYFTGFSNAVVHDVAFDDITKVPWTNNFRHGDFTHFTVEPYADDELIIIAYYKDGKHWVVGFALPDNSETKTPDGGLLRDNWRYKEHES